MARGRSVRKREVIPDPRYNSPLVTRLINNLMLDGEKSTSREIVYSALQRLDSDHPKALQKFEQAVRNVTPAVEVRSRRVGGANYQVPVPVKSDRGEALALRWIINASRAKKGSAMVERLALELQDAFNNSGEAVRKKEITYKMAEANRAFSHFRW
jgi:small subunit ribosomal protein S7